MNQILICKDDRPVYLLSKYGNCYGLIAGATGTEKTISLLVLAEGFFRLGCSRVYGWRKRVCRRL